MCTCICVCIDGWMCMDVDACRIQRCWILWSWNYRCELPDVVLRTKLSLFQEQHSWLLSHLQRPVGLFVWDWNLLPHLGWPSIHANPLGWQILFDCWCIQGSPKCVWTPRYSCPDMHTNARSKVGRCSGPGHQELATMASFFARLWVKSHCFHLLIPTYILGSRTLCWRV